MQRLVAGEAGEPRTLLALGSENYAVCGIDDSASFEFGVELVDGPDQFPEPGDDAEPLKGIGDRAAATSTPGSYRIYATEGEVDFYLRNETLLAEEGVERVVASTLGA